MDFPAPNNIALFLTSCLPAHIINSEEEVAMKPSSVEGI